MHKSNFRLRKFNSRSYNNNYNSDNNNNKTQSETHTNNVSCIACTDEESGNHLRDFNFNVRKNDPMICIVIIIIMITKLSKHFKPFRSLSYNPLQLSYRRAALIGVDWTPAEQLVMFVVCTCREERKSRSEQHKSGR